MISNEDERDTEAEGKRHIDHQRIRNNLHPDQVGVLFTLPRGSYGGLPRDMSCLCLGVQNEGLHVALAFLKGNRESLQTVEVGLCDGFP